MNQNIVVPAEGTAISQHFGHCPAFLFFQTEDGKIVAQSTIPNPGHRPGFLPNFLADKGAQVVIASGMGGGAMDLFRERGIEVILGAQGDAASAVETYLRGELKSTGSICHHHDHADECGQS